MSLERAMEREEEPGEDEDGRIDEHGDEERADEPVLGHVRAHAEVAISIARRYQIFVYRNW